MEWTNKSFWLSFPKSKVFPKRCSSISFPLVVYWVHRTFGTTKNKDKSTRAFELTGYHRKFIFFRAFCIHWKMMKSVGVLVFLNYGIDKVKNHWIKMKSTEERKRKKNEKWEKLCSKETYVLLFSSDLIFFLILVLLVVVVVVCLAKELLFVYILVLMRASIHFYDDNSVLFLYFFFRYPLFDRLWSSLFIRCLFVCVSISICHLVLFCCVSLCICLPCFLSLSLSLCIFSFSFFFTRIRKVIVKLIFTNSVFSQKKTDKFDRLLILFSYKVLWMCLLDEYTQTLHFLIVTQQNCLYLMFLLAKIGLSLCDSFTKENVPVFVWFKCVCVCVCVCIDNRKLNWVSVIENKIYDFFLIRTIHHASSAHKWLVYLDFISCVILSHFFLFLSLYVACLFVCFFFSFLLFMLFVCLFNHLLPWCFLYYFFVCQHCFYAAPYISRGDLLGTMSIKF